MSHLNNIFLLNFFKFVMYNVVLYFIIKYAVKNALKNKQ